MLRSVVELEADQASRPVEDGQATVGVLVHANRRLDVMSTMALGRDLQAAALPDDAVVGAHAAILLDAEHILERGTDIGDKGGAWLLRRHREAGVVIRHEALLQIPVGRGQRLDPRQPQFLGSRFCKVRTPARCVRAPAVSKTRYA